MDRAILHSDMNAFYASVEQMLDPTLCGKAVAVCGSTEDRHGIVLAKSQPAKKTGIKTGMVTWEAKRLCPELIVVPPQYDQYLKYSKQAQAIYQRYTDQVEPFGMDESWLDVTGSQQACGNGMEIAEEIRTAMREELGLTVSIGVSFNKIFAKLGSDMKKPDAITEISRERFQERIWPLPVSELLYVGRASTKKLLGYGICTIGQLAQSDPGFLHALFGKNGLMLLAFARGEDCSRVMHKDFISPIKSIGHGTTANADLTNEQEVWKIFLYLAQDIGHRLRVHELCAKGVQIFVKDSDLFYQQFQAPLPIATQSSAEIAHLGMRLFREKYRWGRMVRSITIRAIRLAPKTDPQQLQLFDNAWQRDKRDRLEDAVDQIRGRFGTNAIYPAALMGDLKLPGTDLHEVVMPGTMYV